MSNTTVILSDKTYNVTKDVVTIWLPAVATFYSALAAIWGLPYSVEVVGTIAAVVTLAGAILKISSKQYATQPVSYDGTLIANDPNPEEETYRLEFDKPLTEMADGQDEVRIKVQNLLKGDSH